MKKIWILIFILIIAINFSGCGKKNNNAPEEIIQDTEEPVNKQSHEEQPDEEEKPQIEESKAEEEVPEIKEPEKPVIADVPEENVFKIPGFDSVDFYNNQITNDFFADNKLTIINIWTTT